MRKLLLALIAIALTGTAARAQTQGPGAVRAELNGGAVLPTGTFADNVDGNAVGASAFIGGPIPNSPFVLGSELGFYNYGTSSRLSVYSTVFDGGIDEDLAVPIEAARKSASNNIMMGHFVVRLQPSLGRIQPYVDGVAGLKYFISQIEFAGDVPVVRNDVFSRVQSSDFAFSYGFGGGVELQVYEHSSVFSEEPATVSLHAGVRYLFGSESRYASNATLREVDGDILLDQAETRTNMIVPQVGIRVSR